MDFWNLFFFVCLKLVFFHVSGLFFLWNFEVIEILFSVFKNLGSLRKRELGLVERTFD